MGKTISCQLTFYPLLTQEVTASVEKVITLIGNAPGVRSETNALNTCLFGSPEAIFSLLQKITLTMNDEGVKYTMQVNISNYCGCS